MSVPARFRLGPREIDLERGTIAHPDGALVPLTANEVRLLTVLVASAGTTIDRERLQTEGLGYRKALPTRAIDQAIWRLRKKIEDDPQLPTYLHSDLNAGYRLVLDAVRPPNLLGRRDELAALDAALVSGAPEVWVVGLPGSGRSSLIEALADRTGAARVRVSARMPDDPSLPVVRLGPLAPEHGEALLVRTVLGVRGAVALPPEESERVSGVAASVDHHPRSLVALGRRAVLAPIEGGCGAEPDLVALLRGLPAELAERLIGWTLYPDPIDRDDAVALGASPADLERAWRACLCEASAGRFRILAPVRAAAAAVGLPGAEVRGRFAARVRAQVAPLVEGWYARADDVSGDRLVELGPRIGTALREAPEDEVLLSAWLVSRGSPLSLGPRPRTACARVAAAIAASEALMRSDIDAALFEIRAARDEPVPVGLSVLLLRTELTLLLNIAAPVEELDVVAARAAVLAEREPTPLARATALQARGIAGLRRGGWETSSADLLEALSVMRAGGARRFSNQILTDLAVHAFREGRAREALVWIEDSLRDPAPSEGEAARRRIFAMALVACGRIEEAWEVLDRIDALGADPSVSAAPRALIELLRGRPERAVVRARTALALGLPPFQIHGLLNVLVWARLLEDDPAEAHQLLDRIAREHPPSQARDLELHAFARAVASARQGEPERARSFLAQPSSSPRWPLLQRLALAFVDLAEGSPVEPARLRCEIERSAVSDPGLLLGLGLLDRITVRG